MGLCIFSLCFVSSLFIPNFNTFPLYLQGVGFFLCWLQHCGHTAVYHITCSGNHLEVRKPVLHISFHIWCCSDPLTTSNASRNHHIHQKAFLLPPNPFCIASGMGKLLWPSKRFSCFSDTICRCPRWCQIPGAFMRNASIPSCLLVSSQMLSVAFSYCLISRFMYDVSKSTQDILAQISKPQCVLVWLGSSQHQLFPPLLLYLLHLTKFTCMLLYRLL